MSLFPSAGSVLHSAEFARIDALPRRRWSPDEAQALADRLTEALRTPNGTMRLFPVQAVALFEAWRQTALKHRGLFASMSTSSGKTLLSLLLSKIFQAKRPVLLLPAKLIEHKTPKDFLRLSEHWQIGVIPQLVSYEALGPVSGKGLLERLDPDLLICDEAHKLRNPHASRTRKVRHFRQARPDVPFCLMTGTSIKRALADYSHLAHWALGNGSPVPWRQDVLEEWDAALSEKLALGLQRLDPGALLTWALPGEIEEFGPLNTGRRAYQRRLSETLGVVCYHTTAEQIPASIEIRGIVLEHSRAVLDAFHDLRPHIRPDGKPGGWVLPDGQELVEGLEIYRHARTIVLGFFQKWRYPAPKEWLEKRKALGAFIREKLSGSKQYDSPDEVVKAFPAQREVIDWQAIRKSYDPETIVVWLDGGPLKVCADWLRGGGIAFVEHVGFGEALAQVAGVPYFGAGGLDRQGRAIDHYHGKACVASVGSNGEGRELQRFSRMLITSALRNGPEWEQTIAREHRIGQEAETVEVDVLLGCKEHVQPFWQSMRDAELHKHADGGEPKLLQAIVDVMAEDEMPTGDPWR
jgi:hypothetical protein